MKRFFIIIASLLLFLSASYAFSLSDCRQVSFEKKTKETSSKRPRSPMRIPVFAIFNDEDNGLYLNFTEDLGYVSVLIWNNITGEMKNNVVDSASGQGVIYISGEKGTYIIQVETTGGDIFEGEFIID